MQRLRGVIGDGAPVVAGRLLILNLDEVKKRLGARWPSMEERVREIITGVLDRRLSRRDFYYNDSGLNFVLAMPSLPPELAKAQTAVIGREILEKIFGTDAELDAIRIQTSSLAIDGSLSFANEGDAAQLLHSLSLSAEEIEEAPHAAGSSSESLPYARVRGKKSVHDIAELILTARRELEDFEHGGAAGLSLEAAIERAKALQAKLSTMREDFAQLSQKGGAPNPMMRALEQTLSDLDSQAAKSLAQVCEREGAGNAVDGRIVSVLKNAFASEEVEEIQFRYVPAWSAYNQVISTYMCQLVCRVTGRMMTPQMVSQRLKTKENIAELDLMTVEKITHDLKAIRDGKTKHVLGVPVHMSTLVHSASLQKLMGLCTTIPTPLRQYLVWEVIGPSEGVWASYLASHCAKLKPYGQAVLARVTLKELDFAAFREFGIFGLSVDLHDGMRSRSMMIEDLERFILLARAKSMRANIWGVDDPAMAAVSIAAGASYLAGNVIGPALPAPGNLIRVSTQDIIGTNTTGRQHMTLG